MTIHETADANLAALAENPYPGRGIVIGTADDGKRVVQVYWIMGRSANSRNRVFERSGDVVRTRPYDESMVEDPSLIIYNCVRIAGGAHIVSNGDQTDTIHETMMKGGTFEDALMKRRFEPDAPNYTPRISGIYKADDECAYRLAILKPLSQGSDDCLRAFYCYEKPVTGIGHMICTYAGDGDPLPPFEGEPRAVPLKGSDEEIMETYWNALNEDNRISLLVKSVEMDSGDWNVLIRNKHD